MGKKVLFVLLFLSFVITIHGDYAVISYYSSPIRILPHDDAYKMGNAQKGDSFKIIRKEYDWYHIEFNKLPAWVHSRYVVERTEDTPEKKDTVQPALPEQSAVTRPVPEKPKPITQKSIEQILQQTDYKKSAETGPSKKASVKGQSKQIQEMLPKQSVPITKNTAAEVTKQGETVSRAKDSQPPAMSPVEPEVKKKEQRFPIPSKGIIYLLLSGVGLVVLIFYILEKVHQNQKRMVKIEPSHFGMDALIIAKSKINIYNTLTNSAMTITEFLSEVGFKVHYCSELNNAKTYLLHYVPDVVIVDWKLEQNIQNSIASILSGSTTTVNIVVIFYHVPDTISTGALDDTIMHAHYFGMTLSDQDISRIVVPLFKFNKKEKRFKESVQATALEGEIQKGNLSEVLQFIEMGKKTGCLYIVLDKPFGLIYFEQGKILYAVSPSEEGKNAVIQILDLEKGYFHFVMNKVSPHRNANYSCLEIVAEWTRMHDEADRQRQDAPSSRH